MSLCRCSIMGNYRLSKCIFILDYFLLWLLLEALIDLMVTNWRPDGTRWTSWSINDFFSLYFTVWSNKLSNICGFIALFLLILNDLIYFHNWRISVQFIFGVNFILILGRSQFLSWNLLLIIHWSIWGWKLWFVRLFVAKLIKIRVIFCSLWWGKFYILL